MGDYNGNTNRVKEVDTAKAPLTRLRVNMPYTYFTRNCRAQDG